MKKIRVLIADDSLTVRKRFVAILSMDPELEVVAEAENGKQAIELCERHRPDVIVMDLLMPTMTGLAATEYIMAYMPTPILVVSTQLNKSEAFKAYDALSAGAVDVIEKGTDVENDEAWVEEFVHKVKLVSRIKVITHIRGRFAASYDAARPTEKNGRGRLLTHRRPIVALGASTGGPGALARILQSLPANFPIPILLVLHIGPPFAFAFTEWLEGQSSIPVRYARDGEVVPIFGTPGVLMAPPDRHLVVEDGKLRLLDGAERHACRPSVDVLFEALAREYDPKLVLACLLTGMGRDGAAGLLELRNKGALTIAQDESTSVVFGMPREAILMNAAELVLPISEIAPQLRRFAERFKDEGQTGLNHR